MTNQQGAPAAVAGCTRSHPHENMDRACRAKAAIAEMQNMAARGAEATAHDLERFVSMLTAAPVEAQKPAAHVQNPAEIEHVAGGVSKNGAEVNMSTQQPAPATQQAVGNSGFDHKTAADFLSGKTVSDEALRKFVAASRGAHDDRAALRAQMLALRGVLASREAEIALLKRSLLDAEAAAPQPSPTAQAAESVPAVDGALEVADAMADSQYLAGVSAGWNAANAGDPNVALQKLHESRAGYLKPLATARAPADSVTAPAAGAVAGPTSGLHPEKCPITGRPFFMTLDHPELGRVPTYGGPYDSYTIPAPEGEPTDPWHERELRSERYDHDAGWWVEGGEPIPLRIVHEDVLFKLQEGAEVAAAHTPPAQAADSVQEDAARWHWMAEYIVGTRTDLDDELIACPTVDELRKLVDADLATRKQGEKHDR